MLCNLKKRSVLRYGSVTTCHLPTYLYQADQFLDRNAKACVSCACNAVGSTTTGCDASGRCSCQPGVTGPKCDRCLPGYYGFGRSGCRKCDCPHTNGICNPANGTCACPTLTTGYRCGECEPGSYGWNSQVGCKVWFASRSTILRLRHAYTFPNSVA